MHGAAARWEGSYLPAFFFSNLEPPLRRQGEKHKTLVQLFRSRKGRWRKKKKPSSATVIEGEMVTPAGGQDFGSVEASCMMDMGQLHPGFAPQNRLCSNVDHLVIFSAFGFP